MTGEMIWQAYCRTTNTDSDTRHDIWKFCGGGAAADELANLVPAGVKTATASTKLAYEMAREPLPEVGTCSVILFDNEKAACVIRDTKVSNGGRYIGVFLPRMKKKIEKSGLPLLSAEEQKRQTADALVA